MSTEEIHAYSTRTETEYPNWDALVAAEANGYVVLGISDRPNTSPVVVGPFPDKKSAKRAQARYRNRWSKDHAPDKVHAYIRILWKDEVKKNG